MNWGSLQLQEESFWKQMTDSNILLFLSYTFHKFCLHKAYTWASHCRLLLSASPLKPEVYTSVPMGISSGGKAPGKAIIKAALTWWVSLTSQILIFFFIPFTEILFSLFIEEGNWSSEIWSIFPKVPQLLSTVLESDPNLSDSNASYTHSLSFCPSEIFWA